jgi:tRNA G18 (ribose-2'-O)-methylase SpoU
MPLIHLDDPADERLQLFRRNERGLANRPQRRNAGGDGLFMAEGDLVVERALDVGCRPVAAMVDDARIPPLCDRLLELAPEVPVYAGGERLRALVSGLGVPLAVVAVFARPPHVTADQLMATSRRLVIAEAVDNPVNLGGIVRNAAGLGWDGLLVDGTSADPLARRSLRVSMGQALVLPFARERTLDESLLRLRQAGWQVVALTPDPSATLLSEVPTSTHRAVLIGSERAGLADSTMRAATVMARIPMHAGVDSLNAAAASAIACYALA